MSWCVCSCSGTAYRGDYCQYDDPCRRRNGVDPCLNAGVCRVMESITGIGYTCDCPLGNS